MPYPALTFLHVVLLTATNRAGGPTAAVVLSVATSATGSLVVVFPHGLYGCRIFGRPRGYISNRRLYGHGARHQTTGARREWDSGLLHRLNSDPGAGPSMRGAQPTAGAPWCLVCLDVLRDARYRH